MRDASADRVDEGAGGGEGGSHALASRSVERKAACAIELLRRATKGGDSTRWVRKRELRAKHTHMVKEGSQATVTGFLLPLRHGVGRAWPRSSGNYGAHKKLDYARLIDAAEEGEELVGRSVRLLGRGMRTNTELSFCAICLLATWLFIRGAGYGYRNLPGNGAERG